MSASSSTTVIEKGFSSVALLKTLLTKKLSDHDSVASEIRPGLFLGSSGSLKDTHCSHVVRCAPGLPDVGFSSETTTVTPKYLDLNMSDRGDFAVLKNALFESGLRDFVREGRENGSGCLIVCLQGKSRSVSIVVGFLMMSEGLRLEEALKIVVAKRPQAKPNMGFVLCLRQIEREGLLLEKEDS